MRLGFGTAPVSGSFARADALKLLNAAYEAGIRHFDTAPLYGWGEGEVTLGEFAAGKSELTLVTKVGLTPPSTAARLIAKLTRKTPGPRIEFGPRRVRASVENSLRALRRDRVEGLLLHEPSASDVNDDLIRALQALRQDGKVASVGLATDPESTAAILERYPLAFDVVQIPVSGLGKVGRVGANVTTILHSVLGRRLERSVERAKASKAASEHFEAETGVSPTDRDGFARLLLGAAMTQNPDGITLFSSSRPETVQRNATLAPLDTETAARLTALLDE